MKYRHFALVLGMLVVFSINADAQRYDFHGDWKDPHSIFGANDHLNLVDIDQDGSTIVTQWTITADPSEAYIYVSANHNHPSAALSMVLTDYNGNYMNAEVFRQLNDFTIDVRNVPRGRYALRITTEAGVEIRRIDVR